MKTVAMCIIGLLLVFCVYGASATTTTDLLSQARQALGSQDYATALKDLSVLTAQGNAEGERLLAKLYLNGLGVTKNTAYATALALKSAEQNDVEAQALYGSLLIDKQDYSGAITWLGKAASRGDITSTATLSLLYYFGKGVAKDDNKAYQLMVVAAAHQDPHASGLLADYYLDGVGTPKSLSAALPYLKVAANAGFPLSAIKLAQLYDAGQGVPQDYAEAMRWYITAALVTEEPDYYGVVGTTAGIHDYEDAIASAHADLQRTTDVQREKIGSELARWEIAHVVTPLSKEQEAQLVKSAYETFGVEPPVKHTVAHHSH